MSQTFERPLWDAKNRLAWYGRISRKSVRQEKVEMNWADLFDNVFRAGASMGTTLVFAVIAALIYAHKGKPWIGGACLGFFLGPLGILIALTLILRHSARASLITGLVMAPLFWLLKFGEAVIWVAVGGGLVLAYRFIIDWNREYRELWLDRQDASKR